MTENVLMFCDLSLRMIWTLDLVTQKNYLKSQDDVRKFFRASEIY